MSDLPNCGKLHLNSKKLQYSVGKMKERVRKSKVDMERDKAKKIRILYGNRRNC